MRANRVGTGRNLKPTKWKGGAQCAVALSFDSDHETSELRNGGDSIGRLTLGHYGPRVGIPRILELLAQQAIPATFFVPAISALLHPDEQHTIVAQGHEIGLHGWIHEMNTSLPPGVERELLLRSSEALEKITGARPVGMRTPSWDFSEVTLSIARELGLLYDSSLFADDDPYELLDRGQGTGIIELPVEWIRDDAVYFTMNRLQGARPYTSPVAVFDIFRREFDFAFKDGGLFQLTLHPHLIAHRSRIWILEQLIDHMRQVPGVWFATHAEIASYVQAQLVVRAD